MTFCLSIGMLAHNEERVIEQTLTSLFNQSIFRKSTQDELGISSLQIVCIPNGCSDETEAVVSQFFDQHQSDADCLALELKPSRAAGKARAWNAFVHEFSSPDAKYLVLVDADILFASETVIEKLVRCLETDPVAIVATDYPVKAVKMKEKLSMKDRFSLSSSAQAIQDGTITGQLYCSRSSELRKIWMPLAIPVEDGFLAAMIKTNGFTEPPRSDVIVRVPDAVHYYDSHETLIGFLRHERRIIVGSVINAWLFERFWKANFKEHAGKFVREENERNPAWLDEYVKSSRPEGAFWLVPSHFMFKRLSPLKLLPIRQQLGRAPVACASTMLGLIACGLANVTLRRPDATRYW